MLTSSLAARPTRASSGLQQAHDDRRRTLHAGGLERSDNMLTSMLGREADLRAERPASSAEPSLKARSSVSGFQKNV